MDAAYLEELAGRLYGLLISLDDRIGPEQARLLHHFIEADEYGLALEEIADMLALAARMNLEEGLVPRSYAVHRPPQPGHHHPDYGLCSVARTP
jgi:hypothetical protein